MKILKFIGQILIYLTIAQHLFAQKDIGQSVALTNGMWFNGQSFEPKNMYSVNGYFTNKKPKKIDTTIDLTGKFILPPFADAHNHNIGTGNDELDDKAIKKFIESGVFYVKIPGNLPMTPATRLKLSDKNPKTIDVIFSQGTITATGGMPIMIVEKIHPGLGYNKGYTNEQLKDFRYFTVDTESELDEKWPKILSQHPDFIKTFLWNSNNFERLKNDTSFFFKGINPMLLSKIVANAHADNLKVSSHVTNAADFYHAVAAGVDEINHLPRFVSGTPNKPISVEDAQLASQKGITVITTVAVSLFQGGMVKEADRPLARQYQIDNLRTLAENGVTIAIGSDDVNDNSSKEIFYLKELGVFDNLTLLKMWSETTPKIIFPNRKIGELKTGYEASFIALDGNPLEDFKHIKDVTVRFKQGTLLKN